MRVDSNDARVQHLVLGHGIVYVLSVLSRFLQVLSRCQGRLRSDLMQKALWFAGRSPALKLEVDPVGNTCATV